MILDLYWKRFFAALLVSFLLHATAVLVPYLGTTVAVSRPGPGPVRTLNATLLWESNPAPEPSRSAVVDLAPADPPSPPVAPPDPQTAPAPTLGADVLPIPAPAYYPTDQLTRRPQPVSEPKLEVPPQLAPSFTSGKVILKLWINELGAVTATEVEKSDVPEAVSAMAAATFAKLRFVPGERDGRPVGAMMRIEVTYDDPKPPQ